ncbi:MAG: hypothetical protein GQ574_12295 [Crocinitomix sp.]|nr:hypothetical protein [Crocinitomix sp.]
MMYMYGFFPIIIVLQVICLLHAYRKRSDQKWYWLILFFPLIGCLIYLYEHFYSRKNIADLSEGVKGVINSNYEIEKLEKEVKYSSTIANRSNLADKYVVANRFDEAIEMYESCLEGFNKDDPFTLCNLVEVYYLNENYAKAVEAGERIKNHKEFLNSEKRISYALALQKEGRTADARATFEDMDGPFSNYPQRIAFCYFLNEIGERDAAIELLVEMHGEFDRMERKERGQKKKFRQHVNRLYQEFQG